MLHCANSPGSHDLRFNLKDLLSLISMYTGVAPPSFLFIRAGTTLYQMTSATGHISWGSIAILALLAVVSILPVIFKRTLSKRIT